MTLCFGTGIYRTIGTGVILYDAMMMQAIAIKIVQQKMVLTLICVVKPASCQSHSYGEELRGNTTFFLFMHSKYIFI